MAAPAALIKIIAYYKQLHTNAFENSYEVGKFLEKYNLLKLIQEEIGKFE